MRLPEDSLVYEKEVRKEMDNRKSSRERNNKRGTPKEVFEGYTYKEIWRDSDH